MKTTMMNDLTAVAVAVVVVVVVVEMTIDCPSIRRKKRDGGRAGMFSFLNSKQLFFERTHLHCYSSTALLNNTMVTTPSGGSRGGGRDGGRGEYE